jgi:hypothetical protein
MVTEGFPIESSSPVLLQEFQSGSDAKSVAPPLQEAPMESYVVLMSKALTKLLSLLSSNW